MTEHLKLEETSGDHLVQPRVTLLSWVDLSVGILTVLAYAAC